ncbi:ABC-type xylose transport system substrate-binding protein [Mycoplasmoides fastidiosum]|uniref:ABC-type xylose transport system substrate-binding protein n=1 Tax=Mycoplasmoides fastidiosum TaxID=92758 RepID=A0ABU0LY68_9BACT|nr:substrate-binding domain-containing protein [Mycoplasmoides fastidiosum]MDQ0513657.1 ABC-type xylose transport system substrate-binding protein [Mycoplasmoides fastidiosum]UUD37923.1 substrate-binding domain-containing protein [Mycoplasmoides fastidiosum]
MKIKFNKKIGVLAGLLTMSSSLVLAACGGNLGSTVGDSDTDRIVLAVADPDNPRWVRARQQITEGINWFKDSTGKSYKVTSDITKVQPDQTSFVETQMNLSPKPKAIVVGAVNDQAAALVRAARRDNIHFLAYDRLINNTTDYKFYASFDNFKVGQLQGLAIVNGITGQNFTEVSQFDTWLAVEANKTTTKSYVNKNIYALGGASTDNNSSIFFGGAVSVINKLTEASEGKVKIINGAYKGNGNELDEPRSFTQASVADWNYQAAQTRVETFASNETQLKQVAAFLTPNDGMASAVINVLKARRLDPKNYIITGQDANPENLKFINDGDQTMTISKPDLWMARVVGVWVDTLLKKGDFVAPTKALAEEILTNIKNDDIFKSYAVREGVGIDQFIKLDDSFYKTLKDNPSSAVFTFLLDPILVNKTNINKYYTPQV